MSRLLNIPIGTKFERYTVLEEIEPFYNSNNRMVRIFKCQCECGVIKNVRLFLLTSKQVKSCGCYHRDNSKIRTTQKNLKHNDSVRGNKMPEYNTWAGMKQRCYYEKHKHFKHYGGRGIKICDRWLNSYENFLLDMGRKPSPKHSIDRIDVNGNYEPSNCIWETQSQQVKNRRKLNN